MNVGPPGQGRECGRSGPHLEGGTPWASIASSPLASRSHSASRSSAPDPSSPRPSLPRRARQRRCAALTTRRRPSMTPACPRRRCRPSPAASAHPRAVIRRCMSTATWCSHPSLARAPPSTAGSPTASSPASCPPGSPHRGRPSTPPSATSRRCRPMPLSIGTSTSAPAPTTSTPGRCMPSPEARLLDSASD